MGLGMIVVVPEREAGKAQDILRTFGHRAVQVGTVTDGHGAVQLVDR
jgi:phosphoribosylaminoimidazole (AIR) synthetase